MNARRIMTIMIRVSIALVSVVVLSYVINFFGKTISDKTSDWGTFGDYFGGILNPIIGILNLLILIYISFVISDLEERRNQHQLASQKKFTLYSLQHDSLKELNTILEKIQVELIRSDENSRLNIILVRNEFNAYVTTHSYLFPFFDEMTWQPLRNVIEELSEISHKHFESEKSEETTEELIAKLSTYNDLKIKFIQEVQSKIEI